MAYFVVWKETECCRPCCEHLSFILPSQGLERLILNLPWPAGTSLPVRRRWISQQLFSAAEFVMQQARLGGLLVLSGQKKPAENHFPTAELALQLFDFRWLWAWPCLGIFIVGGSKIGLKQVRIRWCAFMILMAVVLWRLSVLWWLPVGSSSWSPARQNRGG